MTTSPRNIWPFWLLTFAFALLFSAPYLFSQGMFIDGLMYAVVSRNLAEGLGSFWSPHYSETLFSPAFREHPPLAFGMESLFFKVLGDHTYVERVYSMVIFGASSFLMILLWTRETSEKLLSYFPLMLWVICTGVMWAFCNNMLETTMGLFVLASFYFYLLGRDSKPVLWITLSGICILCAFLTKGPTGVFTLALPGIYWIVKRDKFSLFAFHQFLLLSATGFSTLMLWLLSENAREGLKGYVNDQIINSFENVVTVDTRFHIIRETTENILPALIIGAFVAFSAFSIQKKWNLNFSLGAPFLLSGASGILPIMISLKQRDFYVMAALPVLMIGLALVLYPSLKTILDFLVSRKKLVLVTKIASIAITVAAISLATYNSVNPLRDTALLRDIDAAIEVIPENSLIGISSPYYQDNLSIGAYLGRFSNISVGPADTPLYKFHISSVEEPVPSGYEKISSLSDDFYLSKKQATQQ